MKNPGLHAASPAWLANHANDSRPEPVQYANQVLFLPEGGQVEAEP